ncbi:superoxide dismutase [Fe] [Pseudomonas nabeulensis]|uniref:Superoxide dismutase n=1 Tax=Pseudomonas nabeulensis TaxID=2293833 RepID=A0A4Z0B9E0_9PSED|nr:Fe-Mn family superoxide dismutase [Pseudomonas nabeulensis]TFY95193.1 superoxide dismutase [Fe] [Pseudomonas nabeulensis]
MKHELPPLPYAKSALAPHMSEETLDFHYGKHHQTYVNNLNALVQGTELEGQGLEDIIRRSSGGIFNNAAQIWNHTFFWHSMKPQGGGRPEGALAQAIAERWGDHGEFEKAFTKSATGNFGSGWTWLVKKPDGRLDITNTSNAFTPITSDDVPLLTLDVWEHAYYIDHRNARPKFIETFLKHLVNWDFASANFCS